jgi:hypothetical protein
LFFGSDPTRLLDALAQLPLARHIALFECLRVALSAFEYRGAKAVKQYERLRELDNRYWK